MYPFKIGDVVMMDDGTTDVITSGDSAGNVTTSTGITIPAAAPISAVVTTGGVGVYTIGSLQQALAGLTQPLTKEEQERLDQLKLEHAVALKKAKMDEFKKAPAEMRQFIVNALTWNETFRAIEAVSLGKTQEHVDLEQRHNYGRIQFQGGYGASWTTTSASGSIFDFLKSIGIPDGLSVEDLKQAHVEATLEEEILNGGGQD